MEKRIDILFVNPHNLKNQFGKMSYYATIAQPLGITMLAAYVRDFGYTAKIIDAEALNLDVEPLVEMIRKISPRFLALTGFTTKMTVNEAIVDLLKRRPDFNENTKIIVGGHHPSAIPEYTLKKMEVDYVIKGEGYRPLIEILKGTTTESIIIAPPMGDLDDYPLPAWDLLDMDKYRAHFWQLWTHNKQRNSFALLYTSLGCPYQCSYCSVNVVYGERMYRKKSVRRVIEECDVLYNKYKIKHIEIIDDTFTLDRDHAIDICNALIKKKYDFNIWAFARTDRCDYELMTIMKKAGINWVFFGVESGTDLMLESVNKKQSIKQIKKAIRTAHRAGMFVGTNYIFGLPDDSFDTMQSTTDLAVELCTEWSNFFVAMPYPGTDMYYKADQKDLPTRWEQYGFFAHNSKPLPTKYVSSEDVLRFRDTAFNLFFKNKKYLRMIKKRFGKCVFDRVNKMANKDIIRDYKQ